MKIIMTGGGTGGHIYPAIAIADKIRERCPDSEILFVGTERGLEKKLVPKNGYDIRFITVSGFDRKHLLRNFKTAADLLKGSRQSKEIIDSFKPDMVIGTGGYVCGPVVRAAAKRGIATYVHEQNAFPGATNKLLEKYVNKVFLAFEDAGKHFKHKEKLIVTGNPVRSAFFNPDRAAARRRLSLPKDAFVLLSFGGSGGARRINEAVLPLVEFFSGKEGAYLVFATGSRYHGEVEAALRERGLKPADNIRILEYIDDMPDYLAAADLVISRSGALTVSEIALCGRPAVLIPSPNVTGNHQYYNAKAIADKGGAALIEESELTDERLLETILSLMNDRERLEEMARRSGEAAVGDAAAKIVDNCMNM